ncbi:MAG: tetratricopeptide repeat protein [Candidatus Gastranaerophilales bacterium]|nr:tetratricopeptide repeat protein [Candidatus Gastranaerophilales bacterium]
MKKVLLLFLILVVSVTTSACINNLAIHELNNKAELYLDKGDTETAICRLKSSLDLDNEIYQTHYNLAVAYNNIGNYEGAIEEINKVIELKPDFYDSYYTMAVAKEALAYKIIEKEPDEDGNVPELTFEEISDFNNKAADVVETYNEYLVKKADAPETEQINAKIQELNQKIKEYTDIYDIKNQEKNKQIEEEITSENESEENG